MRVLIEVQNGSVVDVAADGECEVIVVDRDDVGTLPDGTSGLASLWRYSSDSVPTLLMGGDRFTGLQPYHLGDELPAELEISEEEAREQEVAEPEE